MTHGKRWLLRAVLVVLAGLAAQQGLPYLLRWSPIRRALRSRLEPRLAYAFGRPVDVSYFDVSLLHGLRLEANFITVEEDPRFGQEFFLRADSLSAGLDWTALLRGHLRFARFTFTRPSLNVVVAPDGAWNVESWLESRASAGNAAARGAASPERPRQIVVSAGRINFKRGADKQPFALVELDGTLAPEDGGMWRMQFAARLLRAGVALQDAGTLRFQGRLPEAGALPPLVIPAGAQQAAVSPAQFDLAWQRASLSDALRLVTGQDYGVRGSLEGSLSVRGPAASTVAGAPSAAETESASSAAESRMWSFRADLRLGGIHRWDLALRPNLPSVNLTAAGAFASDRSLWEFTSITVDAPRSNLRANGIFVRDLPEKTHFQFLSSSIHGDDLFAWYRAFHVGVADRFALDGYLGVDIYTAGWPPRIVSGALATDGVRAAVPGVAKRFELSRAVLRFTPQGAELSPLTLTLGETSDTFQMSAKSLPGPGSPWQAVLSGDTGRLENLFAAAAALGLTRPQGWRGEGGLHARLRWQGTRVPWRAVPSGTLDLEDVNLSAAALALPVHLPSGHLEITATERRIRFSSVQFLGAEWTGKLDAKTLAGPWNFSLDADRLDTAEFGRWFPPSISPQLVESSLPGDSQDAARLAWPEALTANGRVTVGDFAIGRLRLHKLKAEASIANRRIELSPAEAEFYGGRVHGAFRAGFVAAPRYDVDAQFERVNLAAVTAPHPTLRGCCSGVAGGTLTVTATGVGRDALLKSLEGKGAAEVLGGKLLSLDLRGSIAAGAVQEGVTDFSRKSSARFAIGPSQTSLESFSLAGVQGVAEGKGTVSFSGTLDLDMNFSPSGSASPSANRVAKRFRLTGTLAAPQMVLSSRP